MSQGRSMKNLIKEFRDFINRGNVIDLAVAVIIGGAFTGVVTSLTEDVFNPLIQIFTGAAAESGSVLVLKIGEATLNFRLFHQRCYQLLHCCPGGVLHREGHEQGC